jgi:hypothetical protein
MLAIFAKRLFLVPALFGTLCFTMQTPTGSIDGYVFRISGNHMPSPDIKPAPPIPLSTTVYIYELTNLNQVQRDGSSAFYLSIKTKLIKKVQSDKIGHFKIFLPAGRYSLFTPKDTLFYANRFDKDNNIAPVEVLPGKITKVEVRVDYDATY